MEKQHMTAQEQYHYFDALYGEHAKKAIEDIETADNLSEVILGVAGKLTRVLDDYEQIIDDYDQFVEDNKAEDDLGDDLERLRDNLEKLLEQLEKAC